jgi:DNA invertase Pin-like site-specific DNA recombinase
MNPTKFVALYRVSTQKQNDTHLGLEAQQEAVRRYVASVNGELIGEVEEVETAGNKDKASIRNESVTYQTLLSKRPKLQQALDLAKKHGATLVVKEPGRLTRLKILMNYFEMYRVRFVCADCPNDNAMMLSLRTAINQEELEKISQRTSAALQAKKAQGFKLGGTVGFPPHVRELGVIANKAAARENKENRQAQSIVCGLRNQGKTLQEIVNALHKLDYRTRTGKIFHRTTVNRLLANCPQD